MEGQWPSTGTHSLHFCNWWKPDGFRRQETNERYPVRAKLDMDNYLYTNSYHIMAICSIAGKYPFWSIQVFYQLSEKDGKKDESFEPRVRSQ